MQKSRISSLVTNTVVLSDPRYAAVLTITAHGVVAPTADGSDGIRGLRTGEAVTNHGSIVAATGTSGTEGGIGIDLAVGGNIVNRGIIQGGMAYSLQQAVEGGDGINTRGGTIINSGTIDGGSLYTGSNSAGQGGTGVHATAAPVTIMNSGTISGGGGTRLGTYSDSSGGVGVDLGAGGMLTNSGTIEGGYASYGRGVAIELARHSVLINRGTIFGGNERSGGAVVSVDSQITNFGTVQGVGGYYDARGDAAGVQITGGSLVNHGQIVGGSGNAENRFFVFPPGDGLDAYGAAISNAGTIAGGVSGGGFGGGTGAYLADHASLKNTGTLVGGSGSYRYPIPSSGGIGISLAAATSATNSGIIQGGLGGGYGHLYGVVGGHGGAGVSLSADGVLTNTGTLIGGAGGFGTNYGGAGGDAADINGGTLITSGTIVAGAGGMSRGVPGHTGDAVNFGTLAGTLVIDPGAVFEGAIVGSYSTPDTLVLAGTASGTLSGFDSTILGITAISEDAGGNWTLQGTVTGPGELDIGKRAHLTLSGGPARISTIAFASGGHATLTLGSAAGVTSVFSGFGGGDSIDLDSVQGTSLSYADGTLSVLGANEAVLATLDFAGSYTLADFRLDTDGANTDIVYAGSAPEPNSYGGERGLFRLGAVDILRHFWPLHG